MKVYYAHSLHLYGSEQEIRDISLLLDLGFEVVNPSDAKIQAEFDKYKKDHPINYMEFFRDKVRECDCVAFRSHVDYKIPSGVFYEITVAELEGLPIFEIPNFIASRALNTEMTREYLKLLGQR